MQITPYLGFNGQCREAFNFYADCLGGEIAAMIAGSDTPVADEMDPAAREQIMHAQLVVGDFTLMGGDVPEAQYSKPSGMHVSLHVDTVEEAQRLFTRLSAEGEIIMPLEATFWTEAFAMFSDRYGIPWMINCTIVPEASEGCES